MATLTAPINISYFNIGASYWYRQQKNFYQFMTTTSSPSYIHIKTNINQSYPMWMIEAVGYNYGNGAPVRCAWGFNKSGASLASVALSNGYTGMNADGVYISTDGYVVLRAYAGGHYYNGFCLNGYSVREDAASTIVTVLAVSQNTTTGNYY
jgi:hypothetical protein